MLWSAGRMQVSITNNEREYGSAFKLLHWFMAVALIVMLIAGFFMGDIPKTSYWHEYIKNIHRLTGLLLLLLVLVRITLRLSSPLPHLPENMSSLEVLLSKITHIILYSLMLAIPLSGWFMTTAVGKVSKLPVIAGITLPMPWVTTNVPLAKQAHSIHQLLSWGLVVLVILHIVAAVKHHFINQDNILKRMLFKSPPNK